MSRKMRGALYFRPLALALAFLMMPRMPGIPIPSGVPTAAAQTIPIGGGSTCDPQTRIIRTCDPDWVQFEKEVVQSYLLAHRMTPADEALLYQYGRADVRNDIRALMLARLITIIRSESRTAMEQRLYNQLRDQIWQLERDLYGKAVEGYRAWQNDPCNWRPDPDIAAANNLSYDASGFCGSLLNLLVAPKAPTRSYFMSAAMKTTYQSGFDNKAAAVSLADTMSKVPVVAGLAGAAAALLVGTWVAAVTAYGAAALATAIFITGVPAVGLAASATGAALVAIGQITVVAGPAAIIALAVFIGVTAGFDAFQADENLRQLQALESDAAAVSANAPDLRAFLDDKTGYYKLSSAFVSRTLGEVASTQTPPAHADGDGEFLVAGAIPLPTITYKDWEGANWTVTTVRSWLKHTRNDTGEIRFSPSLRALSSTGEKLFVSRSGGVWIVARPESGGGDCPASNVTGVTPDTVDLANCRSYARSSVTIRDGNSQAVALSMSQPPVFAESYDLTFTKDIEKSVTLEATGAPLPALSASSLPAGARFDNSSISGLGKGKLTWKPAAAGEYTFTSTATNAHGSKNQQVRIRVFSEVSITSSSTLRFTRLAPNKFTVTASGWPVQITTNYPWHTLGLTFKDNQDGTATISGTPPAESIYPTECLEGGIPCGFTAKNDISSVHQKITVQADLPAQPALSASSATFIAGVPNSFRLYTSGWPVPPKIVDICGPIQPVLGQLPAGVVKLPAWLTLIDNGDGTGELRGTPPSDASDYSVNLKLGAVFDPNYFANCTLVPTNFTLKVSTAPQFTSASYGTSFGGLTILPITTNVNSGTITLQGLLPRGLSLHDNGNGTANITGAPAPGDNGDYGGQFPVTLRVTQGSRSTSQTYTVYVLQPAGYKGQREIMFHTGVFNSFTLTGSGFPKAPTPDLASVSASLAEGMAFGLSGPQQFPPLITFRDSSKYGPRTGSAVLSGIPTESTIGRHEVEVIVNNGYGSGQRFPFTLYNVKAGDLNSDGAVNCADYTILKNAFGGLRGTDKYDFRADTNNDGFVNEADELFVRQRMASWECVGTPPTMTLTANPTAARPGEPITFGGNTAPGSVIVGLNGIETELAVQCDLSPIGASSEARTNFATTGAWTISATVAQGTAVGTKTIGCRVFDRWNRTTQQTVQVTIKNGCGDPKTLISAIQGTGPSSLMAGPQPVEVEGVVTGVFRGAGKLNGYFIQEERRGTTEASDGIFIDESTGSLGEVQAGQKVRLRGVVAEKDNLTRLGNISYHAICSSGPAPAPLDVAFPLSSTTALESYEGMLVRFPQQLYVTDTFNLGRFNEVGLAAPPQPVAGQSLTRLYAPTQVKRPGTEANELQSLNDRSRIILDDGSNVAYQHLAPALTYPLPLSAARTLRLGVRVNATETGTYIPLAGVISQGSDGQYRVQPTAPVSFKLDDNARPDGPPEVPGRVRVASMPSLKYFSTVNTGGANTPTELARQRDKIVSGLLAMDPAVIAVTGIENNNSKALFELLTALNTRSTPPGKFEYVNTGMLGTSSVASALLYQPALIQAVGSARALDSAIDPAALTLRNLPAIAQTFRLLAGSASAAQHFTVVATHLKDKATVCDASTGPVDPDLQDGQGNCNLTRVSMARALMDWLQKNPTGDPTPEDDRRFLIAGDFNAHAMEDPIRALTDRTFTLGASAVFPAGLKNSGRANFTNLATALLGGTAWSHAAADSPDPPTTRSRTRRFFGR